MTTPIHGKGNPYEPLLEGKDPLKVLAATPARLVKVIDGLTTKELHRSVVTGKWSIAETIAHLAHVELIHNGRCRWLLFEENPTLMAFEPDAWVKGWHREKESINDTIERFRILRRSFLNIMRTLTPEELTRRGQHSKRGEEDLAHYISRPAGHDLNHLQQIINYKKIILAEKK